MVFEILRQILAGVQTCFQLGMGNVPGHDDGTVQADTGSHGILRKNLANLAHGLVEVDTHGIAFACLTKCFRYKGSGIVIKLLYPDAVLVDLCFDVAVGRARYAQTNGARCAVARQTDDTDVVCKVFSAKLRAQGRLS